MSPVYLQCLCLQIQYGSTLELSASIFGLIESLRAENNPTFTVFVFFGVGICHLQHEFLITSFFSSFFQKKKNTVVNSQQHRLYSCSNMKSHSKASLEDCWWKKKHASPTRVVERRSSVDGGSPVGLDEPISPRPGLSGPAAERQEVEVAGEPHVRCNEREESGWK